MTQAAADRAESEHSLKEVVELDPQELVRLQCELEDGWVSMDDYTRENESLKENIRKLEEQGGSDSRELNVLKERFAQVMEENKRLTVAQDDLESAKKAR